MDSSANKTVSPRIHSRNKPMSWVFSSVLPWKALHQGQARGEHTSEGTKREVGVRCMRTQRDTWIGKCFTEEELHPSAKGLKRRSLWEAL